MDYYTQLASGSYEFWFEFGHPFVNPVIDGMLSELLISTQSLFDPIKLAMADQAHTT